jgi:hypothetical protein
MPNHLTRNCSPAAQALAERLATEGPIVETRDLPAFWSAVAELADAGVAQYLGGMRVALTSAGAAAHRAEGEQPLPDCCSVCRAEEQARRTAHAGAVGIVTRLGYLYCRACVDSCHMVDPRATPIAAGSQPHAAERCDACGRVLDATLAGSTR